MRKEQKQKILNFINLFPDIQQTIEQISVNHHVAAEELLQESVKGLELVKNAIEASEGAEHVACMYVEKCIQVFPNADKTIWKELRECIENEIKVKREVVFLPYKASMWDSLESVWMAARDDEECDAYVIPIPYYDKDADGICTKMHWEGDQYPDYVPITRYDEYDIVKRRPDMIFIHNPYDECNHVTSVHPDYYARVLKDYTDKLVYIPYFVLGEIEPDNEEAVEGMRHFCYLPGTIYADKVIVQSEKMREIYINEFLKDAVNYGLHVTRKSLEEKFLGIGSPKFDKVVNTKKEDLVIPEEWIRIMEKEDGSYKKVIFYNTSLTAFLENGEQMLIKIQDVLGVFQDNQEEITLLWRPHPLMKETILSLRPDLWESYEAIVQKYRAERWGIYDDSVELDRAIAISDAYYGDPSSVVALCQEKGIPVMMQNVDVLIKNNEFGEKNNESIGYCSSI